MKRIKFLSYFIAGIGLVSLGILLSFAPLDLDSIGLPDYSSLTMKIFLFGSGILYLFFGLGGKAPNYLTALSLPFLYLAILNILIAFFMFTLVFEGDGTGLVYILYPFPPLAFAGTFFLLLGFLYSFIQHKSNLR